MTFVLKKIERKEWIADLNKIKTDKKWLLSVINQHVNEYYSVGLIDLNGKSTPIGACTLSYFNVGTDCSLFIFQEYRRKGYAKQLITDLITKINNIQFAVSISNSISLNLFESISLLKNTAVDDKNKTITFKKIDN